MTSSQLARDLRDLLALNTEPVAVSFLASPPAGVSRLPSPALAGCGYWKAAAEGRTFWTTPEDHMGCVVGAYTHGVALPADKEKELGGQLDLMIGLHYVRREEVPQIPHRTAKFEGALFGPLSAAKAPPDAVLVRGNVRQMMLVAEAAQSAGLAYEGATLGRPTCAFLPETVRTGRAVPSFGCIGNRIYTELPDGELWYALPGSKLDDFVAALRTIANANRELARFHQGRVSQAAS